MTIGIIKGELGSEGGREESLENWVNNAIMNYSRGSMMTELYVSPSMLKREEWQTLGSIMRWAQDNSAVLLRDTRFIGEDPGERQVYGYSHFSGGRGIVTLRNPSIEAHVFELAIDEPGSQSYRARVIYPYSENLSGTFRYGDTLNIPLEGFEVKVIEFGPPAAGIEATAAESVREPEMQGLRIGGRAGAFTLTTPDASRLAILCESPAVLRPALRSNGQPLPFTAVSPRSSEQGLGVGGGGWTFVVARVAPGRHQIEFDLPGVAKVSAWVIAEAGIGPVPIPASGGKRRRVTQLFSREW
jgi:hypothetical protein